MQIQGTGHKGKAMQKVRSFTHPVMFLLLMGFAGCDSLGEAAAQGTQASLRTLIDLLLTDFANQVADSLLPVDDYIRDHAIGPLRVKILSRFARSSVGYRTVCLECASHPSGMSELCRRGVSINRR